MLVIPKNNILSRPTEIENSKSPSWMRDDYPPVLCSCGSFMHDIRLAAYALRWCCAEYELYIQVRIWYIVVYKKYILHIFAVYTTPQYNAGMINRLHNAKSHEYYLKTYTNHDSRTAHCEAARARTLWIVKNKIPQQHSRLSGAQLYNLIIFILGTYAHCAQYMCSRAQQLSVSVCAAFCICRLLFRCPTVPSHGIGFAPRAEYRRAAPEFQLQICEHCRLSFFWRQYAEAVVVFYLIIFIMFINSTEPTVHNVEYIIVIMRRAYRVRSKHRRKSCCVTHKIWYNFQTISFTRAYL